MHATPEFDDAVANLTISSTPTLIRRQRVNLGSTRSRGVELEGDFDLDPHWRVVAGALLSNARVLAFDADPTLVGLQVPQVPRRQGSLRVAWHTGLWEVSAEGRWSSEAFDDDRNELSLGAYSLLDVRAAIVLRDVQVFVTVENALGESYFTARTPGATLGSPRLARVGMRWSFDGVGARTSRSTPP